MRLSLSLVSLVLVFVAVLAIPAQVPLRSDDLAIRPIRHLQGRFLHITDLHPDPYYLADKSTKKACHRKKPKKERQRSGYYGTPFNECDSPLRLTNFTLEYLGDKWAKHIDFVIWTGDSARHDNDRKNPRTPKEIFQLNRYVAGKMEEVFQGIPIIPTLGNNDVWPHNILNAGPNSITNEFSSIWKSFIPFHSYQVFQRGAYFSVEVIPNSLAVISLNTMYFYDSNKAVGGCEFKERQDPGNLQFDWLEVQLHSFRQRRLKVWIIGHVPPSSKNYFPECYYRYTEISLRFQDTILGHLFGHMNTDHFSLIQADDLELADRDEMENDMKKTREDLDQLLLKQFAALPENVDLSRYGVVSVSPSVVPNPYLPSFRIFSYNISQSAFADDKEMLRSGGGNPPGNVLRGRPNQCEKEPYRETWRCRFSEPWHTDPDAPSRRNVLWTPLGYAQYYAPKLGEANATDAPKFRLEYVTYGCDMLHPKINETHDFQYPVPLRRLPRILQNTSVTESKYTPYGMKDLTIGSWVRLAQELGDAGNTGLRKRFKKFMYMGKGRE